MNEPQEDLYKLQAPPKPVGYWRLYGDTRIMSAERPNWFHRWVCGWLIGWVWIDNGEYH